MSRDTLVLGIDTASNRFHWVSNHPFGIDEEKYGWVTCDSKNADERRAVIYDYACGLFSMLPDHAQVFVEEPLALRNGKTTRLLCLVGGAVWAAYHANGDGFFHWVDVAHWKKEVVGNGNASKEMIREHVLQDHHFHAMANGIIMEDFEIQKDLYDAYCLMRYGMEVDLEAA